MKCPRCENEIPEGLHYCDKCSGRMKGAGPFAKKYLPLWIGALALIVAATVALLLVSGSDDNQLSAPPDSETPGSSQAQILLNFTDMTILCEADALAAIGDAAGYLELEDPAQELADCQENVLLDSTYYRFSQSYHGIPVYGRDVTVSANSSGTAEALSSNYLPLDGLDTTPELTEAAAVEAALTAYSQDAQAYSSSLAIYSLYGAEPVLAWQVEISDNGMLYTCFVDASTGVIVASFCNTLTETVTGMGMDNNGNSISFNTSLNDDGTYSLIDEERNLIVYDADGNDMAIDFIDSSSNIYHCVRATNDSEEDHLEDSQGRIVELDDSTPDGSWVALDEDGNIVGHDVRMILCYANTNAPILPIPNVSVIWNNPQAVTVISLASKTYDFYQEVLQRNGWNGQNGDMHISVNDAYGNDPTNAGSSGGSGGRTTFLRFGINCAITQDTVAHEFTHSVERSISDMAYSGESGALMEALSDIFGELTEDWTSDRRLNDSCNWIHGDRNMVSPSEGRWSRRWIPHPYPSTYHGEGYCTYSYDNNGVHINSTVISHAAYQMTHPTNSSVEALTNTDLAEVLYKTIGYLPSDCTFAQFANYVRVAASVLELSEGKIACIEWAFQEAGITPNDSMVITPNPMKVDYLVTTQSEWRVYDRFNNPCDNYTLRISEKQPLSGDSAAGTEVIEHIVDSASPLLLQLEPGYQYRFELIDGTDPSNVITFTVGISDESSDVSSSIEIETDFGQQYEPTSKRLNEVICFKDGELAQKYTFTYNPDGQLTGIATQKYEPDDSVYYSNTTTITYDAEGRMTRKESLTDGDFHSSGVEYTYNAQGQLISSYAQAGGWSKTTYEYDSQGRLSRASMEYDFGSTVTEYFYEYNEAYLLSRSTSTTYDAYDSSYSYTVQKNYTYDEFDRLTQISSTDADGMSFTAYTYDYKPFTLVVSIYDSGSYANLLLCDAADYTLWNLNLKTPEYEVDADSYLTFVTDGSSIYEFLYDGASSQMSEKSKEQHTEKETQPVETTAPPATEAPTEPATEPPASQENNYGAYQSFVEGKEYLTDWKDKGLYPDPSLYALIDINQDGSDELIILSEPNFLDFSFFLVYGIDSGSVVRLNISAGSESIYSCYDVPQYSSAERALAFSVTDPVPIYGGWDYYTISGQTLTRTGSVSWDASDGTAVYSASFCGETQTITEAQKDGYLAELSTPRYLPLP